MRIEEAVDVLQIGPESIRNIILKYYSGQTGPVETEAKNTLIRENIKNNPKIDLRELVLPIPDLCYTCNGLGTIYSFHYKTSIIACPDCKGTGTFTVKCNKCENGSILYKRDGKNIVIKCPSCNGTGIHSSSKCRRCIGTGKIKRAEAIEIKSIRLCSDCNGTGKYKKRGLSNPLLTPKQAITILK